MTVHQIATCVGFMALAGTMLVGFGQPVQALTMKECSAKYQAAKAAGTLNGQNWRDFRKAQCGAGATARWRRNRTGRGRRDRAKARRKRRVSHGDFAEIFERVSGKGADAYVPGSIQCQQGDQR
jgi:hypothetical protein